LTLPESYATAAPKVFFAEEALTICVYRTFGGFVQLLTGLFRLEYLTPTLRRKSPVQQITVPVNIAFGHQPTSDDKYGTTATRCSPGSLPR
jgi:hypothetical protein